ncbi:RDD family protein [Spongiactinospora sp. TRM90649]|uniref:RDD family protein n=1 Tax=Spongiactinospora sp. TRM90649 TaxID=3031114 RepID=UPI0023F8B7A1|nr:RDD family protein [Spongiactinospora sp. TRM90649]MDF5758937.1 RDD family protein [Spongiactinospora sp. TRM90649]
MADSALDASAASTGSSASTASPEHDPKVVPAEWWERMAARIIDAVPFVVLYYILFTVFWALFGPAHPMSPAVEGAAAHSPLPRLIAWLIVGTAFALYDVVLHSRYGRTLGKHVLRIRLIPADGGVLTTASVVKRAAMLPWPMAVMGIAVLNLLAGMFLFAVGLFILVDKPRQQGLHDKVARTMVARSPR